MNPGAAEIRKADLNDAQQALEIEWADGHQSAYPLKYLRSECPCAGCRTERDEARANPFRVIGAAPSAEIVNIEAVGRYALRFSWKDGHNAGIYTFDHLRALCPCPECKPKRAEEGPFVHGINIPKG